jgi:HEAT repeat protein
MSSGAYERAESDSWEERAAAGRELASEDDLAARTITRRLLDDPDLAVIEATADALIRRGDSAGLELVLSRLATAEDQVANTLLWIIWPAAHLYGLPMQGAVQAWRTTPTRQ